MLIFALISGDEISAKNCNYDGNRSFLEKKYFIEMIKNIFLLQVFNAST